MYSGTSGIDSWERQIKTWKKQGKTEKDSEEQGKTEKGQILEKGRIR
jgi:hypothetical protein